MDLIAILKSPLNCVNINFLTFKKLGDRKFLIDSKEYIPLTYLSPLHLTFATFLNSWLHFHHVLTFSPLLTLIFKNFQNQRKILVFFVCKVFKELNTPLVRCYDFSFDNEKTIPNPLFSLLNVNFQWWN